MEGWDADRRVSFSANPAAVATFWSKRCQIDLGRRGRGGRPRGPGQSASDAGHAGKPRRTRGATRGCHRAHRERYGSTDDLLVGLQLTHSGRFCRPNSARLEPRIVYHHPLLDARFGIDPRDDAAVLTDQAIEALVDHFVRAAGVARDAGFSFVDIKACHGYLLHEFLSAHVRPGTLRWRLCRPHAAAARDYRTHVRQAYPELMIVVRLKRLRHRPLRSHSRFAGATSRIFRRASVSITVLVSIAPILCAST